jgi:hypothetical protein
MSKVVNLVGVHDTESALPGVALEVTGRDTTFLELTVRTIEPVQTLARVSIVPDISKRGGYKNKRVDKECLFGRIINLRICIIARSTIDTK